MSPPETLETPDRLLEHSRSTIALVLFVLLFLFRYTRLFVGIYSNLTYGPRPIQANPKFRPADVTVIVPTTFKDPAELVQCLRCITACGPAAVLIVTALNNVEVVKICCAANSFDVQVMGVEKLNKRRQMVKALKIVETRMIVFADDDVFWPERYLDYLLAIFEDDKVGAGGTRQRTRRDAHPSFWNFLGISYLERRVFNNIATNAIDGSISTLSGRTSAYRTEILKCEEFFNYFVNDSWRGRPLNTDDDKGLTRWVYGRGWKICIQAAPESVIETTLEGDRKYLHQCLRWARSHWRGNFTVMQNETYWRSTVHWFGLYYIYIGQFQTPAALFDGLLFLFLWGAVGSNSLASVARTPAWAWMTALAVWIFFTKLIKLFPHFWRHPTDLRFIPVSIAFSYLHGIINLYALCTMHFTHWGSQNLQKLAETQATAEEVMPLLRDATAGPVQLPALRTMVNEANYFDLEEVVEHGAVEESGSSEGLQDVEGAADEEVLPKDPSELVVKA
ncbi:hypothetical protein MBLNU230_g1996t1 [Neophaeotheca triangularis]